jgi:hypothetical protein
MTIARSFAPILLLSLLALPAQAQWLGEHYAIYGAPMSNFIAHSALNNTAMINAAKGAAGTRPLLANGTPSVASNAEELAQRFAPHQRAPMAKAYVESMSFYQKIEAKMGWPRNDIGGALAAFIVGNYWAYTGVEVSDAQFAAVAEQLRKQPGLHANFKNSSAQALRAMYEQSAMVGAFMVLALKSMEQAPEPEKQARLRAAAGANLTQVFGVDPARLGINEQGMGLR